MLVPGTTQWPLTMVFPLKFGLSFRLPGLADAGIWFIVFHYFGHLLGLLGAWHFQAPFFHSLFLDTWLVSMGLGISKHYCCLPFIRHSDTFILVSRGLACPSAFLSYCSPDIRTPLFWSPWAGHVQAPSFHTVLNFLGTLSYCT